MTRRLVSISEEDVERLREGARWLGSKEPQTPEDQDVIEALNALVDRYEQGITVEEAELLCKVSQDDSFLRGPVRIIDGREDYPIHPTVEKLHRFHTDPERESS